MAYPNHLAEYRMMFAAEDEAEAESKLGLFQAFSKLYEGDRKLLDDMLAIDANNASQIPSYIQGMICDQQVYIISNLASGKSKSLYSKDSLWTIGRDPRQSDLAVLDKRLSRCHAALQYSPDQGFIISDLESTNGTYVNGEKLKRVYTLRDGDRIRIGSSLFYFFICGPASQGVPHASQGGTHTSQGDNPSTLEPEVDSSEGGRTLH
ncbi:FHA domain-containing protein [Leptolyngbya sp. PCC 7375]|nr:FHA domain-containing protein [Leptolyngbya sp. PCC 7375]